MERKIEKGDLVLHVGSKEWELVDNIVYNDPNDFRSIDGDRVTINGTYWYIEDIKAVKPKI